MNSVAWDRTRIVITESEIFCFFSGVYRSIALDIKDKNTLPRRHQNNKHVKHWNRVFEVGAVEKKVKYDTSSIVWFSSPRFPTKIQSPIYAYTLSRIWCVDYSFFVQNLQHSFVPLSSLPLFLFVERMCAFKLSFVDKTSDRHVVSKYTLGGAFTPSRPHIGTTGKAGFKTKVGRYKMGVEFYSRVTNE